MNLYKGRYIDRYDYGSKYKGKYKDKYTKYMQMYNVNRWLKQNNLYCNNPEGWTQVQIVYLQIIQDKPNLTCLERRRIFENLLLLYKGGNGVESVNIQQKAADFFGGSCYAYCIAYLKTRLSDFALLTKQVIDAYCNGYIEDDGYVCKPHLYYGSNGVKKVTINDLSELPDGMFAVEYSYNDKSHFVVANKDGVIFDPYGESSSVKFGKPVSYRRFV